MAREDLVSSAVSFLQDPSVAASSLDKRVAFLQSKNLTQEEIDLALARAGDDQSSSTAQHAQPSVGYASSPQAAYRPSVQYPNQAFGYGPYGGFQPPPPELPRRDWRDWFIMATVMGGVGYGMYTVAKRYVVPLIAPPTPPQLQQDKESIDEQFSRAFDLLEQLSADTAALKSAEEARAERLDEALSEVETVVTELKQASRRREDETRRISDEVRSLQDALPKALEGVKEGNDKRLKELGSELKSLKILMSNRLGSSPAPMVAPTMSASNTTRPPSSASSTPAPRTIDSQNGVTHSPSVSQPSTVAANPSVASHTSTAPSSAPLATGPLGQYGRSASIPAWQLAAANKAKGASASSSEGPNGVQSPGTN